MRTRKIAFEINWPLQVQHDFGPMQIVLNSYKFIKSVFRKLNFITFVLDSWSSTRIGRQQKMGRAISGNTTNSIAQFEPGWTPMPELPNLGMHNGLKPETSMI